MTLTTGTYIRYRTTSRAQQFAQDFAGYPEPDGRYVISQVDEDGCHVLLRGLPRKIEKAIKMRGGVPIEFCEPICGCPLSP